MPEYINGQIYRFSGAIVTLQCVRGDYMKFKINDFDKRYNLLIAYPLDGKKTEDYTKYYKKSVNIDAEIIRESLYKKPKVKIHNIELAQKSIFNK